EVASAISAGNQYQPLGQFDGTYTATTIYDTGGLTNAAAYQPLIVAYKNGSPVRLEDAGRVLDSLQNDRSNRRHLNKEIDQASVTLAVQRQPGANTVKVADAVRETIALLESQLPGSLQLKLVFDRSQSIRESIKEVEFTLILAFILVVLVIFVYLGKGRD